MKGRGKRQGSGVRDTALPQVLLCDLKRPLYLLSLCPPSQCAVLRPPWDCWKDGVVSWAVSPKSMYFWNHRMWPYLETGSLQLWLVKNSEMRSFWIYRMILNPMAGVLVRGKDAEILGFRLLASRRMGEWVLIVFQATLFVVTCYSGPRRGRQ